MNILYLGLFRFPEGDAAASRILNNARLFRDLGHTVKILSFGGEYRVQDASPGGYIYDGLQYEITHDIDTHSLKERVQMLTSSLVYGGPMTFEQIKKLDWLKNTSEYGILFYLREAERYEWIKTKCFSGGKPNIYSATAKGRRMAEARD